MTPPEVSLRRGALLRRLWIGRYCRPLHVRHLVTLDVVVRPATFATASERAWKDAVREAVDRSGCEPARGRFAVRIEFRLPEARTAGEVLDLDNLIKPTLDAMEGVFGLRRWRGVPQPADDRVDRIDAVKRGVHPGEKPGATIEVLLLGESH